ncbi:MAG: ABC transporter substrate-binding protein [Pseudomonadota bacterium]
MADQLSTKLVGRWLCAALLTLCGSAPVKAEVLENGAEDARMLVEELHNALLAAKDIEGFTARAARLEPQILERFDLPRIGRISIGREWRKLDDAQREAYLQQLGTLVVATYADRFDTPNPLRFVTQDVAAVKNGFVVKTTLERKGEDAVTLDYFVRSNRIFNVVANGVSDLSLRRADYSSVIKQEGFGALLAHLTLKIAEYRNSPASED